MEVSFLPQDHAGLWRVIYIARGQQNAEKIGALLEQAGFLIDRNRSSEDVRRQEDIEIRVLDAEAAEARLFLMEQGL